MIVKTYEFVNRIINEFVNRMKNFKSNTSQNDEKE